MLRGVLPPVVAALILVSAFGARTLPLAMVAGLFVADVLLVKQWPALPHELWSEPDGQQWLLWSLVALGLVTAAEHFRLLPRRLAASAGVAVAAFAVLLMLEKVRLAQGWSDGQVWTFVGGGGLLAAMLVWSQRRVLTRAPRSILPGILWTVALSLDAVIVTNGDSALLGQLCGAVAAALGAAIGCRLWRKDFALQSADGMWLGLAHGLFLLAGVQLAYLEWTPALIALCAPLLLLALPKGFGEERTWRWVLAASPLLLAPLAVAVWLSLPEANPYGY